MVCIDTKFFTFDAFQKLLERTQARKEQLAKKKEELAACRNKRNAPSAPSPVKPRRPLSEDNTDTKDQVIDDTQKRRINSDSSVPKTPKEATTPSKAPIIPKRATTPKAYSVHKGPSTPSSMTKVRGGVEIDNASPSIQVTKTLSYFVTLLISYKHRSCILQCDRFQRMTSGLVATVTF